MATYKTYVPLGEPMPIEKQVRAAKTYISKIRRKEAAA